MADIRLQEAARMTGAAARLAKQSQERHGVDSRFAKELALRAKLKAAQVAKDNPPCFGKETIQGEEAELLLGALAFMLDGASAEVRGAHRQHTNGKEIRR
jgi:hypothetical protein